MVTPKDILIAKSLAERQELMRQVKREWFVAPIVPTNEEENGEVDTESR